MITESIFKMTISPILGITKYFLNRKTIVSVCGNQKNFKLNELNGQDLRMTGRIIDLYDDGNYLNEITLLIQSNKNIFIYGTSGIGKNRLILELKTKPELQNYSLYNLNLDEWRRKDMLINFSPKESRIILFIDDLGTNSENLRFINDKILLLREYEFSNINFIFTSLENEIEGINMDISGKKILNNCEKIQLKINNEETFYDFCINKELIISRKKFREIFLGTPNSIINRISPNVESLLNDEDVKIFILYMKALKDYLFLRIVEKNLLVHLFEQLKLSKKDLLCVEQKLIRENILFRDKTSYKIHDSFLDRQDFIDLPIILESLFRLFLNENFYNELFLLRITNVHKDVTGNDDLYQEILNNENISLELKNAIYLSQLNELIIIKNDYLEDIKKDAIQKKRIEMNEIYYNLNKGLDVILNRIDVNFLNKYENFYAYHMNLFQYHVSNIYEDDKFDSSITNTALLFGKIARQAEKDGYIRFLVELSGYKLKLVDRLLIKYILEGQSRLDNGIIKDAILKINKKINLWELNKEILFNLKFIDSCEQNGDGISWLMYFSSYYNGILVYFSIVFLNMKPEESKEALDTIYLIEKLYPLAKKMNEIYMFGNGIRELEESYLEFLNNKVHAIEQLKYL